MNELKRIIAIVLCMMLLFVGCGDTGSQPGSSQDSSTQNSKPTSSDTASDGTSSPTGDDTSSDSQSEAAKPNSYEGVDRNVLGSATDIRRDIKALPAMVTITPEQIAKCMGGQMASVVTGKEYAAPGQTKAIKLSGAGQVMFSEKLAEKLPNGLDEAVVLDPVDGSLAAYEGIRMYIKIKRPAGKTYSRINMRFFNGSYSYYRQFSEITVTLPDGDYEGYIECPFSEFVSGYNKEVKANNKHDISFFGFNISMEGNPEGLEVYVSDFGAYREMYW